VQRGAVRIDGVDVKEMDLAELRDDSAWCCKIHPCSAAPSAEYSAGDGADRDEQIQKAAEDVNLGDFIRSLPKGFEEEVRERGSTLSTGQKQSSRLRGHWHIIPRADS